MALNSIALPDLLPQPEADWLDWKADFPAGLLAGRQHPEWENERAKLLRALISIGNTIYDHFGYVVYGVDDSIRPRTIRGTGVSFDDAMFQDWNRAVIRPQVDFQYHEEMQANRRVGIFEIRPSANYPHVIERSLGQALSEGQVWLRLGTRCTVARHEELRRMFEPPDPILVNENNGPIVQEIRQIWAPLGWEPCWPTQDQKADRLAAGLRMANLPGSRREIHHRNHVLMLRRAGVIGDSSESRPNIQR